MTPASVLLARIADDDQSPAVRADAATELSASHEESAADALLEIASHAGLGPVVGTAVGASLGHLFFRFGRHMDNFALRDLSDEAFEAFDDTVAQLLLRTG